MKMLQRNISMLCLIAMLFSMTACGHNTKDEEAPESYVASFFDIPDSVTYISRLLISDNKAYVCCQEGNEVSYLAAISIDNGDFQKLPLVFEDSTVLLDFGIDQHGSIWAVCKDNAGGYSLKKFDSSNAAVQSVDLS